MASKRWILLLLLLFCFRHCSGYDYDDDDDDDNGANQRAIRAYELNDDDGGEGRRGFVDPNGTAKLVSIVVVDTTSTTTTTTTAANRSELVEGLLVNTLTKFLQKSRRSPSLAACLRFVRLHGCDTLACEAKIQRRPSLRCMVLLAF
mmetsp:Transcript_14856/g.39354  ORF Transcript_14856/g.39354 Transcript_14856/m.39354 type:complete len:147 (-) Transcript_14856:536-976(-)